MHIVLATLRGTYLGDKTIRYWFTSLVKCGYFPDFPIQ